MIRVLFLVVSVSFSGVAFTDTDQITEQIKRGEYVFNISGCASCHTREGGAPLAGGLKMETKFGVFYAPNITPDRETGIGGWSDDEFIKAMTQGESPDGQHYYPSFPYTSYSNMTRQDLLHLKRYLDVQPAIQQENKAHELIFPFNIRPLLVVWKWLNFNSDSSGNKPKVNSILERGAYLVNGPGHCAECHSPRNLLGGLDRDRFLQGNPDGPEGESVPGITMEKQFRISEWSGEDIMFSLQIGMVPEGDFLGGSMGHVIENSTSKLTDEDLQAITVYLQSIGR